MTQMEWLYQATWLRTSLIVYQKREKLLSDPIAWTCSILCSLSPCFDSCRHSSVSTKWLPCNGYMQPFASLSERKPLLLSLPLFYLSPSRCTWFSTTFTVVRSNRSKRERELSGRSHRNIYKFKRIFYEITPVISLCNRLLNICWAFLHHWVQAQ